MNSKEIWHIGAWNRNYGDHVLQASLRENLQKISDYPLNFTPVDCQNTKFYPALIDKINEKADLLVVGGGGLIFHRPNDKSVSGWQFNIELEDLEKIEVPIVIYGIGYNKFHYDDRGFKDILNKHLQKTQEVSSLFSVRDQGTKDELIKRGLNEDEIEVIPDSGMFLEPTSYDMELLNNERLKIGINWVSDRPQYTFPSPHKKIKNEVVKNITASMKTLIEQKNAQIVCIEHIPELDKDITSYMKEVLDDDFVSIENDFPELFPPSLVQASFLVDIYRQMDLVIGMRGHSNIIPFGTKTPFIALGSHNKNRFFLDQINEKKYLLDIRNYKDECSKDNILNKIDLLLSEKADYKTRNKNKYKDLKSKFDYFNQKIINLLEE